MIGCLPSQALAFLTVFVYATHATQAIAFEWKPGLGDVSKDVARIHFERIDDTWLSLLHYTTLPFPDLTSLPHFCTFISSSLPFTHAPSTNTAIDRGSAVS